MNSNFEIKATSVSYKGMRDENEDQFEINTNMSPNFFAVYDGHGGEEVSNFLKQNLSSRFKNQNLPMKKSDVYSIFNKVQKDLIQKNKKIAEEVGSTCLCVLQQDDKLNIINCGDCRCVISNNKRANQITRDHKPEDVEEKARLTKIKGKHELYLDEGIWRIGPLSVSRSFGDTDTAPYIIQKPDVFTYTITDKDDFAIIACDGLWDVMSNQDVINFVHNNPQNTVRKLGSEALRRGTTDNISIILLQFNHTQNQNKVLKQFGGKSASKPVNKTSSRSSQPASKPVNKSSSRSSQSADKSTNQSSSRRSQSGGNIHDKSSSKSSQSGGKPVNKSSSRSSQSVSKPVNKSSSRSSQSASKSVNKSSSRSLQSGRKPVNKSSSRISQSGGNPVNESSSRSSQSASKSANKSSSRSLQSGDNSANKPRSRNSKSTSKSTNKTVSKK